MLGFIFGVIAACAPIKPSRHLKPDPSLPEAYQSPEALFATWTRASQAQDEAAIRACYWPGLGKEELEAWLQENLRPEAKELFLGATLLAVDPQTPVEVRFRFSTRNGTDEGNGVMVKTRLGWKLQSW